MPQFQLPIFALNLVLFPGTPQLLHIFEPRYRQMLADALDGDRRFGISFVEASDDDPSPTIGAVGCRALVHATADLPDGKSNIFVVGEDRYVLKDYIESDRPYRLAVVETIEDDEEDEWRTSAIVERVLPAFRRYGNGMAALNDQPPSSDELPDDPMRLSFVMAAAIDVPVAAKQELLTLQSTPARLEQVEQALRLLNDDMERRVEIHQRGKKNGKGTGPWVASKKP
jgi:Lon protease-like protein